MLGFENLRIGDFAYIRDDLECGKRYGSKTFVSGSQGMKKGVFLEIFSLKPDCIGNDIFLYSKEMIDISKSLKRSDYFKKKEQTQYTFNDLIDVVVQAVKDKVINGANIRLHEIGFMHNKTHYKLMPAFDCKEQIDFIQSLYKETFVIECEDDVNRVKKGAEITLSNGNKSIVARSIVNRTNGNRMLEIKGCHYFLQFFTLKGATVEQDRNV